MLKNKSFFTGNPNIFKTGATESCLNDSSFDVKVSGCQFEEKSRNCELELTTKATTTQSPATNTVVTEDKTYFILAIVFIAITGIILLLILMCCIILFKGHRSDKNKNSRNDIDITSLSD